VRLHQLVDLRAVRLGLGAVDDAAGIEGESQHGFLARKILTDGTRRRLAGQPQAHSWGHRQIRRLLVSVHAVVVSAVCEAQVSCRVQRARSPQSCLVMAGGLTPRQTSPPPAADDQPIPMPSRNEALSLWGPFRGGPGGASDTAATTPKV
jgi:hypothetical protein